jgi:predicted Na+-dependent transporter
MAIVVLIATAAATVAGGGMTALGIGLVLCAPFGLGLACCAAFSATADPYAHMLTPEVGLMPSIGYVVAAAPPAAAALAVGVPLLSAREAQRLGGSAEAVSISATVYIAVTAALAVWFLGRRFVKRDAVKA